MSDSTIRLSMAISATDLIPTFFLLGSSVQSNVLGGSYNCPHG
jgi:hypothetical protein